MSTESSSADTQEDRTILLIGSGPIQIGQAAEFDYSGAQACRALQEEGARVVLVNSNPATIMTDPEMADEVYIEPITTEAIADIIEQEQPDGVIAGLGGQTGLNVTAELADPCRDLPRILGSALADGEPLDGIGGSGHLDDSLLGPEPGRIQVQWMMGFSSRVRASDRPSDSMTSSVSSSSSASVSSSTA
jgi:hypothetical protein